ncbi:anthrax toxin-like adenylyl cyclase domain-containing protein [Xenorhabdus kozodoii]|uniref:Bifunctional hemolysin-adenylate cyclase n=1 Tax=Xenorhabdus kozodoii TaxID=351676 RepID=A0A2D0LEY9_9GAMM|nr:anthrax toxin-like adenylyl cyclase domain-containing protein [Xenorhabdus kozodoii]PHM74258.1 bifunctional hemolysin-adenylate cyclase precursor [Xenorhabdus kozodoii]
MQSNEFLYQNAFIRVANRYKVVIGVRKPNPLSLPLLEEGAPSKNFHMKAKSSSTGPTAGYITADPKYSKIGRSINEQNQYRDQITSAIRKGAKEVDLVISRSRLNDLQAKNELKMQREGVYSATYHGENYQFHIDKNGKVFDRGGKPVKVMTNPDEIGPGGVNASSKPITADYDLFTIIPRKQQNYNLRPQGIAPRIIKNKLPKHIDPNHPRWNKDIFNVDFLKTTSHLKQEEDVNKGNVHFLGKTIIKVLNAEIRACGYSGGDLIWHNDETGNPFTAGFDPKDRPTFFLPGGRIVNIHSIEGLREFYSNLELQGFSPENNPRF